MSTKTGRVMHNARDPDRNKEDKDMGWGCSGGMGGCDGEREKGGKIEVKWERKRDKEAERRGIRQLNDN